MGSIIGEEPFEWDSHQDAHEEKIFVAVRLRPLNDKELTKNDVVDWECINNTTILFKNPLQERSLLPTAYTFDRVFGSDAPTRKVYEEAAKKVALSVLSGMNSTIFAYGQTSSGKTYTMSGVTEYAVADIYNYISRHSGREFVLRFSAMEIYNEVVRDLLTEGTPLRLLDDPERGTVVDKLTEVRLTDSNHLTELLSICEAQRQIGETNLNEVSSRSHQILRLTVESEAREYYGAENSSTLTASVNFVDLAGSERASQTSSAGTRLKEGCHINRSLLTLGTVIRKLSKGRNGHIPYRDSKLTRILQNSLGGNARTAIICTMSPAHSHVEQSRNTLLFASCAKQVNTNAQVNVVMSEKALVKQLQRELARLENELRNLSSLSNASGSSSALREKELLIEKMEKQIRELTLQRDLAQSRAQDMLRSGGGPYTPTSWLDSSHHERSSSWADGFSPSESDIFDPLRSGGTSATSHFTERYNCAISSRIEDQFPQNNEEQFLSDDTSPRKYIDKYFGPDPCKGWEKIAQETNSITSEETNNNTCGDSCKEVRCIEPAFAKGHDVSNVPSPQREDHLPEPSPSTSDKDATDPSAKGPGSEICKADLLMEMNSSCLEENECSSQKEADNQGELSNVETRPDSENLQREISQDPITSECMNEDEQHITTLTTDCTDNQQEPCTKELDEVVEEPDSEKHVENDLDMKEGKRPNEPEETADKTENEKQSGSDWPAEFERQKREIIQLWDACHIPLVHRTYFFLLFRGDPSDAVYVEVELRRLSFLKNTAHGATFVKDDQFVSQATRAKALNREREMLSKKMLKKYSEKEREALYEKWCIDIKSKQRRLQLSRKLWTNAADMEHINESAAIVAKLVGFQEPGQAPKEMFGLSFSPKPVNIKPFSWRRDSLPSMM